MTNIRVSPRIAKRFKTLKISKLGNFKEMPQMFGIGDKYSACHQKDIF